LCYFSLSIPIEDSAMENTHFIAAVTIPGRTESIRMAALFLVQTARSLGVPISNLQMFETAIVEVLNQAQTRGSQGRNGSITGELELAGRCLKIRVLGEGAAGTMPSARSTAVGPSVPLAPDESKTLQASDASLHIVRTIFSTLRAINRGDRQGIEMELNF
jgi:hypothetical protein